jgi:LacI family transcriptional regulator
MYRPPRVALLVETSVIYGRGILSGITKYLREHFRWSLFLEQRELGAGPPPWLATQRWDGIISRATTPELAQQFRLMAVPVVDLNDLHPGLGFPRIVSDHRLIGTMGAEHLMEKGYLRFGFCGFAGELWSRERREGFRDAIERVGARLSSFDSVWRGEDAPAWDEDQARLADWLGTIERPAAIMACNDARGRHVLEACSTLGINVPEELAVIGVDDERIFCDLCSPPLSSVRPNPELIGYQAAAVLDGLMAGGLPPAGAVLSLIAPIGIVARQSTDASAILDPTVAAALRFIRDQALHGCTVEDLLAAVPMSRSALERRFRKHIGRSPQEEIWAVRLGRIKELLRETDLKLPTIAELCGIEHPEYLSVVFKRETGMTPGEYRAKTRMS